MRNQGTAIMQDTNEQLTKLFIEYHDALERYCKRLVHYDSKFFTLAEDAVQIAFFKALTDPKSFTAAPNKYGWLAVCCKNYISSKLRQQKNRNNIAGRHISYDACENVEDPIDAVIRWMDSSYSQEIIDSIYTSLSSSEKRVFEDYYLHDCSLEETAKRNSVTVGSVRGAVQRIRKKAKELKYLAVILLIGQCISEFIRTV